ncbi:glycosyltransferase family 9 protein [Mesohalobacter halotolerans]|uniref:Glycosyltransferase family 9 protein n=1 Tax=Mesohalobacter halotolerans TaxID=1883405 RepID=A0A4U5TQD5_9FLAO|nr:glycosyltransferase family 9 protein [Mesohalobacter halotolerans]TKS56407.1 glycosyltransferase family 9 protein [Mesohalobacter halotolerans]
MKILVIQQKMIGDVLTSSVICENLKRNFPNAEVHYLINRFTLPVVENNPYIDEFVIFEDEYRQSKIKFYKFLKQISKSKYTHVFDAYGKLESLLISRFSKAKYRFGFRKSYSKFYYTQTVKINNITTTEAGSAIENRIRLLQLMPNIKLFNNKPKIYLDNSEIVQAKEKLSGFKLSNSPCIMISALGSIPSKNYPLEYMAKILDCIVKHTNAALILNYMPSQQAQIDHLKQQCNSTTQNHIIDGLQIKSLRDFMAICKQCAAIIGNEGGAINIAKALDIPSFSIFSPWILKEGWNSFEKNHPNTSVHLSDFQKKLHIKNDVKYIKKNVENFYAELRPEMIQRKLIDFLDSCAN